MSRSSPPPGLVWRVQVDSPLSGVENMAWDHTLALDCPGETGILRLYRWARPTLSLGRHEPARGMYAPDRLAAEGVDVVRRPTGGRAVLHHRELTYAVAAPIRPLGGVREAYRRVNHALARGLELLGAPVGVATRGTVAAPDAGPCFRAPAPGEVTAVGRKLVGSAQARFGDRLLQHGSILFHDDQGLLDALASPGSRPASRNADPGHGSGAPERSGPGSRPGTNPVAPERPATLSELVDPLPALEAVQEAVVEGFRQAFGGDWRHVGREDSFSTDHLPRAPRSELLELYASREWTWRR